MELKILLPKDISPTIILGLDQLILVCYLNKL